MDEAAMTGQSNGNCGGTAYSWHPAHDRSSDARVPDTGMADAGVIVLIHGLGLTRGTWDGHLPALRQRHDVLTYDLAGHGESDLPLGTPDLTLFATQLCHLLDRLEIETCHLVGFSLGGMINRRFAMDHPDRVLSLVILNSPHERSPEAQALVEKRAADTEGGGPGATIDETLARWFTPAFLTERPDVVAVIRDWVLANDPQGYAACRAVLAHGVRELIRPEPAITHPALVVTCENDSGSTPAMSYAIASEITGAQVEIIPRLQHLGLIENPDLFTASILRFIEGLSPDCQPNHSPANVSKEKSHGQDC
jgi:pimeloyl-ACP methyl ester carboxylesterase